jgi:hypothetical protein
VTCLAAAAVALFAVGEPGAGGEAPAQAVSPSAAAEEFSAATEAYQIAGAIGSGATAALAAWLATGGLDNDPGASVRAVACGLWAAFGGWWLGRLAARGDLLARAVVWVVGITGGVIVLGAAALIAVSGTVREVFRP